MVGQMQRYQRGSEWRKWDLHVHTPASIINGFTDWESYIEKLSEVTKRKGIEVLGITDYFLIDGYEKIVTEYRDRLEHIRLLLPNIEFRLNTIVYRRGNKEGRRLNFHVIFSDKVNPEDIKEQFLSGLKFCKGTESAGELSAINLTKRAIEDYGRECKSKQVDFKNDSDLEAGFKNASFKIDEIVDALKNKPDYFKDKYLFFLESEFWSDIDWGQDYGLKSTLLQVSHGVFNSNPDDIKWFLGQKYHSQEDFIREFGRLFPCIHGSDAHCESELESRPDLGRYCWIKADPTFDGLKQIVCEPEERVYIGEFMTKGKNAANVIDNVIITNSNNWFSEEPILLNENLVAVIGERGSGKTALADLIALAGGDFNSKEDDLGSFVFKALKPSKQIEKTIEGCIVTINWQDKTSDSINLTNDLSNCRSLKKVRYLSQSFIEEKCKPEHAGELQREIENIIFQHIPIEDRMTKTDFNSLREAVTQSIEVKKSSYKEIISNLNEEIFQIEKDIGELEAQKEEVKKLMAEIEQLDQQKPKLSETGAENIEGKLILLKNRKNNLNEQIATYKAQLGDIRAIRDKILALRLYIKEKLAEIENNLKVIKLAYIYEESCFSIPFSLDDKLDKEKIKLEELIKSIQGTGQVDQNELETSVDLLSKDCVSDLTLDKVSSLISILESKSTVAKSVRETIKRFEEKIEKNRRRVSDLESRIRDTEEVKKPSLPEKRKEREKAYRSYCNLLEEEKNLLGKLYAPLREKLNANGLKDGNQVEFFARIELNVDSFFNRLDGIIDFSRKGRYYQNKELLLKEIKTIAEKIELTEESDLYSLISQLYDTFEKNQDRSINIDDQLLRDRVKIDFYNAIFGISDFSVTYSIKYRDTSIELLSPGKKGIVLLLMYLALDTESTVPLIIDQPEENLDNKSIYSDLLDFFRKTKKRRQIIIITHNPNLVLNTDAEQVIVADFEAVPSSHKARIIYVSGSIENSYTNLQLDIPLLRQGIREHGADILEGGKQAFVKRMKRYEYS